MVDLLEDYYSIYRYMDGFMMDLGYHFVCWEIVGKGLHFSSTLPKGTTLF